MWRAAILLANVILNVKASPFQLTENYVEEFKAGIETLKKIAAEYQPHELSFDPALYNETEALKEALEYDFIVVGAGGSGAVVASRLSEVPEWKILLLEAGGPETAYTKIPYYGGLLQHTPYNWGFTTTPQKNWCQGMIEKRCAIAGGKALGGSTAINGMVYTRGNAKDYDLWADLGNDGWCYDDVLPYFKKAEDAHLEHFDNKYHNHGGPLHIENPQYSTDLKDHVLEAAKELHLNIVDYNGKDQLGVGVLQTNSKKGKRQSTATAYLEPASKRPNLVVKPFSHVTKLLISPHTKTATGVQYLHDGKLIAAKAAKEVVVSAGAINTPQILMLSGIGPKEELAKFEIPMVEDLKVGHNFKDHIGFYGLDFIYNTSKSDVHKEVDEVVEYLKNGAGPLTSSGHQVLAYVHTDASKDPPHYPDIEHFFYDKTISGALTLNPFKLTKETHDSLWGHLEGHKALSVGVMLAHPKSTGIISLRDKDPLHHPLVDPNQLSDPDDHDLTTMVAGVKSALRIVHATPLQELGVALNDHSVAGCDGHHWGSDDYWKCAIKHLSISLRHVSGTAKMGPETDKDAVVDNKLRVKGVHHLRVVDSSVIPVSITGHTMAPAVMIGEKAADLIKDDWTQWN